MKSDEAFESFSAVLESLFVSDNSDLAEIILSLISERNRQTLVEGYTTSHDDEHTEGQLALLAAAYALSSREPGRIGTLPRTRKPMPSIEFANTVESIECYGWEFTQKDPIRDLTRAGALILAELERLWRKNDD